MTQDQLQDASLSEMLMAGGQPFKTWLAGLVAQVAGDDNVGMYRPRSRKGVIRPNSVEQVRDVLRLASQSEESVALHALSTGRNWGLGSREAAQDASLALDLSGLKQVRALDLDAGWAVVEPGVTQGQLAALLAGSPRMINVTASSAHSSVLGNGVDRGVGLRRQRVEDLVGLEVVLPDGEVMRVGWWPDAERPSPVYPYGLGPSPLQLFFQSNLGVVTAAVVRLMPRPEALRVVRLSFARERLAEAIDVLQRWSAQGMVRGVLKVYDATAGALYGGGIGEYLTHVCVDGTAAVVEAMTTVILDEANRSGLFLHVSHSDQRDPRLSGNVVAEMVASAYAGDPSRNDTLLQATLGQDAENIDAAGRGWLFFLPLIPFHGEAIDRAQRLLAQVYDETGVHCGATINALNSDVIDYVVAIKFERNADEARRAHQALDRLYQLFSAAGFIPYRLDVDHQDWIDGLSPDQAARDFVRGIKGMLDPRAVIAPGRYA
ncbi:FAD-binding oxidoreductase [Chromobacterium sp. F49]|nr:FAD-binding oxidoreductase [Chromobacterium sp. F49]